MNENFTGPKVMVTPEGGIAVLLVNRTGAASVKGAIWPMFFWDGGRADGAGEE